MGKKINKINEVFFKKLCQKYDIVAFFLFGSQSTGKTTGISDVDIAYIPRKEPSLEDESELLVKIMKQFKRDDIDLVDLTKASLLLKYSVINSGDVIACVDNKYLYNYIIETRRDYLDTAYIRNVFSYYIKKRIASGNFGEV